MLSIEKVRSSHYLKNLDKHHGANEPCIICGKTVGPDPKFLVHLHCGGNIIVTDVEAAELNAQGRDREDMYCFPVGPDCAKKPELQPYLNGGNT